MGRCHGHETASAAAGTLSRGSIRSGACASRSSGSGCNSRATAAELSSGVINIFISGSSSYSSSSSSSGGSSGSSSSSSCSSSSSWGR